MSSSVLCLDVYGIKVNIIANKAFLLFVKENYPCFVSLNRTENVNIKVTFSQEAGNLARARKNEMVRWGEGLYRANSSFYWENEFGFVALVKLLDVDIWEVIGYHFDLLNHNDEFSEDTLKNYQRSMRWLIHFPVFSLLEKIQGKRLVHASSVSKNGKAVVLAGLNKVGKSSVGMYLFKNEGFKYVSDNFLLTDGGTVYAFPERGRLAKESIEKLAIDTNTKETVYGKLQRVFKKDEIEMTASPEAVFIIGNFSNISCYKIENWVGNKTLEGLHRYLQEFPEYAFYSVLDSFPFWERNSSLLFRKDVPFYHLNFPLNWTIEKTTKEILKCTSIT